MIKSHKDLNVHKKAFALACNYISKEDYKKYINEVNKVGKMLTKLHQNWKSFNK